MSADRVRALLADKRVRIPLIAALVIGGYFLAKALLPEIDLQDLLEQVASTLGEWTYLAVGLLAFLETGAFVGLVAPGETFVILAGAVAGVGETSLIATIAVVWCSAWAGDTASFFLGRHLGRGFILRYGPRVRITEERLEHVEGYFERHGGKTILIGRFIGLVRALAPFIAGSSRMSYRAFVPFSVLGTGLWGAGFTVLGYVAARSLEEAAEIAGRGTFLFGLSIAVVVGIVLATRFLREPENRERLVGEMEKRRGLRPLVSLGRRIKPQARFVWGRLTPGGLGLELTSLIAVLSVALFVAFGYLVILEANPNPTGGDRTALTLVRDIHAGWLTDLNLFITDLGRAEVVLPLAAVAAILLALRRRLLEAAVLVAGMVIIVVGVDLLKEAVARPRPPDLLIYTETFAYPSGHAANSVFYAWAALTLSLRIRPPALATRIGLRTIVLIVGFGLTAAIGLSRVYVRVHWLSDVAGGWAFGFSAFALCGIVAILVAHLRRPA